MAAISAIFIPEIWRTLPPATLNVPAVWLAPLLNIQEVTCQNLRPQIGCPEVLLFPLVSSGDLHKDTSNSATATSFYILSSSLLINL